MRFFERRDQLISYLSELGITGEAAQLLAKTQALQRHLWRVQQTIDAAKVADPIRYRGLLALDLFGIGGPEGTAGLSTDRIPGLHGLGKGRKNASDGAAWSAAIRQAYHEEARQGSPEFLATRSSEGVPTLRIDYTVGECARDENGALVPPEQEFDRFIPALDAALSPWLHAIAAAGLQLTLRYWDVPSGVKNGEALFRGSDTESGFRFFVGEGTNADRLEELKCWAALYNACAEALSLYQSQGPDFGAEEAVERLRIARRAALDESLIAQLPERPRARIVRRTRPDEPRGAE